MPCEYSSFLSFESYYGNGGGDSFANVTLAVTSRCYAVIVPYTKC